MILEHAAIWTANLEKMREFYARFFNGTSSDKYINHAKKYESYFITFGSGARLELMTRPDIPDNLNDTVSSQYKGLIHLAFEAVTKQEVDEKAAEFKANGFRILDGPRTTGDGCYEFVTLDPDSNRIEITTREIY